MKDLLTISADDPVKEGDYQVVKFIGEFDKVGHMGVRGDLDGIVKKFKSKTLVFDFSGLKFINSESIGYLMDIHNKLAKKDAELVLVGPDTHVKDVLKTIGIADVIPVYGTITAYKNKK
jgi:anti-anti-sigma factor